LAKYAVDYETADVFASSLFFAISPPGESYPIQHTKRHFWRQ